MTRIVVVLVAIAGATCLLWLGQRLPALVASHFDANGRADSFMPRGAFIGLMVVFALAVSIFNWWLLNRAVCQGKVNMPNAGYWLRAERAAETHDFLRAHMAVFSVALSPRFRKTT